MKLSVLLPFSRQPLVHAIAVVWFTGQLIYEVGYGLGSAFHQALALRAAAIEVLPGERLIPTPEPQIEQVSPLDPICPGAWWDLIDPSEASEADPELPLRWAV